MPASKFYSAGSASIIKGSGRVHHKPHRVMGLGVLSKIKDFIVKVGPGLANSVLKKTGVLSKLASRVSPAVGSLIAKAGYGRKKRSGRGLISSGLSLGSNIAGFFGLGRKRKRRSGRGLLSSGLKIGSSIAGFLGLGRKRRRRRRL